MRFTRPQTALLKDKKMADKKIRDKKVSHSQEV